MKPIVQGPICRTVRLSQAGHAEVRKQGMALRHAPFRQGSDVHLLLEEVR